MHSNNLGALNDAMFAQLDRLVAAEGPQLEAEIERAKAVTRVADRIISNGNLALAAVRASSAAAERVDVPKMLEG